MTPQRRTCCCAHAWRPRCSADDTAPFFLTLCCHRLENWFPPTQPHHHAATQDKRHGQTAGQRCGAGAWRVSLPQAKRGGASGPGSRALVSVVALPAAGGGGIAALRAAGGGWHRGPRLAAPHPEQPRPSGHHAHTLAHTQAVHWRRPWAPSRAAGVAGQGVRSHAAAGCAAALRRETLCGRRGAPLQRAWRCRPGAKDATHCQ